MFRLKTFNIQARLLTNSKLALASGKVQGFEGKFLNESLVSNYEISRNLPLQYHDICVGTSKDGYCKSVTAKKWENGPIFSSSSIPKTAESVLGKSRVLYYRFEFDTIEMSRRCLLRIIPPILVTVKAGY